MKLTFTTQSSIFNLFYSTANLSFNAFGSEIDE